MWLHCEELCVATSLLRLMAHLAAGCWTTHQMVLAGAIDAGIRAGGSAGQACAAASLQ